MISGFAGALVSAKTILVNTAEAPLRRSYEEAIDRSNRSIGGGSFI